MKHTVKVCVRPSSCVQCPGLHREYNVWVYSHLPLITPDKHVATAPHLSMWDKENWGTKCIFVPGSGTRTVVLFKSWEMLWLTRLFWPHWQPPHHHPHHHHHHPLPLRLWQPRPSDCPSLPVISLLSAYRYLKPAAAGNCLMMSVTLQ